MIQHVLRQDGPRALDDDDTWFSIPASGGFGGLPCGRAAQRQIEELVQEAARKAGIRRRASAETVERALKPELTRRFITERRPVCEKEVQRFLAAAGKAAQKQCQDRRHLIPCRLMQSDEPDRFSIGPVTFLNRAPFRKLVAKPSRSYLSGPDADRQLRRRLLKKALQYYRGFQWIAEVEVLNCDQETSETLAESAVTSAVDFLHLVLGRYHTRKMRVGGAAVAVDGRAKLGFSSAGALMVANSAAWPGHYGYVEGWSVILHREDLAQIIRMCGIALEAAADPDLARPLSWRILDAARWFGEAAREESASTAVVKYATALERLVMTEEQQDISALFITRLGALCADPGDKKSRLEWEEKAARLYALRSKLVHGSLSPQDPVAQSGVGLGAAIGELAIARALLLFDRDDGLRRRDVSTRQLKKWFAAFVMRVEELESRPLSETADT